jgi:7-cyano-7-deazaguanine reductase
LDVLYKHLKEAYEPDRIRIEIEFRPRGGISSKMTVDSDWGHLGGTDQHWQYHKN